MAVRVNPFASTLNTREWYHSKETFNTVFSGVLGVERCVLNLNGCCRPIPVFAFLADQSDTYKNDITSFISEVPTNATVVTTLTHTSSTGVVNEVFLNNNLYGIFYNTGTLRANVWGFIVDWFKVASAFGFGTVTINIKIQNSLASVISDYTTPCYNLQLYSCENAHGTVRIETQQLGYIVNGFDYRNLNVIIPLPSGQSIRGKDWPQQFRWYGRFKEDIPTLITDKILDTSRNEQQVQTQLVRNYELKLHEIRANNSEYFLNDYLLSNNIKITDYNQDNINDYREVRVNPLEITGRTNFAMNQNEWMTFSFEEYNKSTLKRH